MLAVGVTGAVIARLEPLGMARTLFTTALAQFLVPVVALILWRTDFSQSKGQLKGESAANGASRLRCERFPILSCFIRGRKNAPQTREVVDVFLQREHGRFQSCFLNARHGCFKHLR